MDSPPIVPRVLAIVAEAYLLGSIPFGYLLYRLREGGDVRSIGSGNIGATNVLRGAGVAAGTATLALDVLKGFTAVFIAGLLTAHDLKWMSLAAVIAMLGHMFPIFLKLRGGKGVATTFGAFLAIAPVPVLYALIIFALIVVLTRYVSLASIVAVGCFPFVMYSTTTKLVAVNAAATVCAVMIIFLHRSNIRRLVAGKERRVGRGPEARNAGV